MSVTLTGDQGWGTRIGRCLYLFNQVDQFRGPETDALASGIFNQFTTLDQIAVDSLFTNRDAYRTVHAGWLTNINQVATTTTVYQVNRDDPLSSFTIGAALRQLIDQLTENGDFVGRPTVTCTTTADAGNEGDAELIASEVDPVDGGVLDYCFTEVFNVTVAQDAAAGATQYQELTTFAGDPIRSPTDYNWPGGSGVNNLQVRAIDGETNTLVTDGGFESWTGLTTPNNWTIVVGASTVSKGTASPLRGSADLRITSDGSTLTRVRSTALSLAPQRSYAFAAWVKISATAAGTLVFKLVDGTGTTVNNEAGAANEVSVDTNTDLTTSYALISGFFQTPRALPSTLTLDIHLTAAPTSGRILDIDTLSLTTATQLYPGGPFVAMISGADAIIRGDKWTMACSNSATNDSFGQGLERLFQLRLAGLKFPSTTGFVVLHDGLIAQG